MPVALRPLRLQDVTARYVGWLNGPEVTRWLETKRATLHSQRAWVRVIRADPTAAGFAIVCRDTTCGDTMIGTLTLRRTGRVATLGLMIGDKAHWRRRYGTCAIRDGALMAKLLWRHVTHVQAGIRFGNNASVKTFRAAGFRVRRDCGRWIASTRV